MLRAHKGEIPFLFWLLPFIAGIVLGMYTNGFTWLPHIIALFSILLGLFIGLNIFHNRLRVYRHAWTGGVLLNLILLTTGWLCSTLHHELNYKTHFSKFKANYIIASVVSEPKQKGIYSRFIVNVENVVLSRNCKPVTGNILVTLTADSNAHLVNYGDVLLMPATYKPTDPPFNHAEFDYKQYLARQNIYHQSFISRREFKVLKHHGGNPVIRFSLALRRKLVRSLKHYIKDPEAAAIASTLLLGYKADLSADTLQAYSKTGTIHVLSVSGAHMGIIFIFISFLLKPLKHHRYGRLFNALLSLFLIWTYVIITGLPPAVCRAAVMLSMLIVSQASGRQVHSLNVLGVSAFGLLLYNPFLIADVGFQLSYLAVFGLVALQPIIYDQLEFENKWKSKLWRLCAFSVSVQLITFPLSVYYFHQFPVYFLLSNLLIILPAEAIVIIGMLFLLSSCITSFEPLTQVLAYALEHLILIMNKVLFYIEHLPYASIGQLWLTEWEHLLLYLVIAFFIYLLAYKKAWHLNAALFCVLILCCSLSWKYTTAQSSNHIIFFNVKKNLAVLFKRGNQATVITNLAFDSRDYQYSIQPCLDSIGVNKTTICSPDKDIKTAYLQKENNLIQFMDKTLLLFNPSLQNVVLPEKLKIDYLYFTHNPHSSLAFINNSYTFKHFIADASNSTNRIKKLELEGDNMLIKINSLKRNKSIIVASNN
jgi:competence protein ComEC